MSKKIGHNPHDSFFRAVFSEPENTAAFLQSTLPAEVSRWLKLETLALTEESFVDEDLRSTYADLI